MIIITTVYNDNENYDDDDDYGDNNDDNNDDDYVGDDDDDHHHHHHHHHHDAVAVVAVAAAADDDDNKNKNKNKNNNNNNNNNKYVLVHLNLITLWWKTWKFGNDRSLSSYYLLAEQPRGRRRSSPRGWPDIHRSTYVIMATADVLMTYRPQTISTTMSTRLWLYAANLPLNVTQCIAGNKQILLGGGLPTTNLLLKLSCSYCSLYTVIPFYINNTLHSSQWRQMSAIAYQTTGISINCSIARSDYQQINH